MLRKHIYERARLYAALLGVCAAGVMLLIGMALAMHLAWLQTTSTMDQAHNDLKRIQAEIQTTFGRLQAFAPQEHCTEKGLARLRGMMLDLRYVRDIGMYDEIGRLFCTTGVGRLSTAFFETPSSMINSRGQIIWLSVPLLMNEGATQATIVREGLFNVVLDPVNSRIQQGREGIDAVWFVSGRRMVPINIKPHLSDEQREQLQEFARFAQGEAWHWRQGQIVLTRAILDDDYVVQSVISPARILAGHGWLVAAALLLAGLFGANTYYALLPRLRHLHSLQRRLPDLIDATHLQCVYQPIVELDSGRVIGCEVLMRMQLDGETVFPDQVIPLIIEQGLSWQLDRVVSQKAIAELRPLLQPGQPFKMAFNFFPENLGKPEFKAHLSNLRQLAGSVIAINIEVTEYSFAPESIEVLHELKADGYFVSVDDFGTGYSNLGTIKRVAPDFLKIDKSFVFEMEDASLRSNLIPEIVSIGRAVGADLIAEGIENERQAESLRRMGVRYGQGYYFSRPLAVADFCRWMEQRSLGLQAIAQAACPLNEPTVSAVRARQPGGLRIV